MLRRKTRDIEQIEWKRVETLKDKQVKGKTAAGDDMSNRGATRIQQQNGFVNNDAAIKAYSNDIVSLSGMACDRTSVSVLERVPSCQEVLMDSGRGGSGEAEAGGSKFPAGSSLLSESQLVAIGNKTTSLDKAPLALMTREKREASNDYESRDPSLMAAELNYEASSQQV